MPEKVAILGGGVAGLSAAHELVERGFEVSVYESKDIPGGKARSLPVPYTGTMRNVGTVNVGRVPSVRRHDLPGEHGFRFFPGFYQHIVDTMGRIPYRGRATVADNLVDTHKVLITRFRRKRIEVPARFPRSPDDFRVLLDDLRVLFDPGLGISWEEKLFFGQRIWQILTSCDERRQDEYEKIGWWDFIGAGSRSEDYQKFFAIGITRSLVAARAEVASTKTIGDIFVQLLFDIVEPGASSDRVLNGPTNEVWIDPWLEYLRARGVQYHLNSRVTAINVASGHIRSVTVEQGRRLFDVQADYYIAAVPVEVMARLVTPELIAADPALGNIIPLSKHTEWMNGIQFFLTEDVPIARGHVVYVDSPWALTSISQRQFWPDIDLSQRGTGRILGVISVDISNWDSPGLLYGKPARECTREEIRDEVWEQLKRSLNVEGEDVLRDAYLYDYFLDPAIDPLNRSNGEPLLVNLVNSWRLRPEAATAIPNLFLASDYVRTYTDLATMEGANEAARRAVNGIIQRAGISAQPCQLWKLHEPALLEPLRAHDRARYRRGLPWDDTLARIAGGGLEIAQGLGPVLGVGAAAGLAALEYLERQYPHADILKLRPELLVRLARADPSELQGHMGELAPLLAQAIGSLPSVAATLRTTLQDLGAGGSAAAGAVSSEPAASEDAGRSTLGEQSAAERPSRVRFVQR